MTKRTISLVEILGCVGVFGLLCLRALAYQYSHVREAGFVDDAFYYLVVARHIVGDGMSTFDGTTLTNGYHPLWMALLALQFKALGQSLLLTRCIEYLLGAIALVFTLLLVRLPNFVINLIFTIGFFAVLSRVSLNGMETALFACCFALFAYVSLRHSQDNLWGGFIDGILAVAVVASRIDAIVFVLPQLLCVTRSWYRRASSVTTVLLCGAIYASLNRHYFGISMPVSGEVKSLGGVQLNWALFRFLTTPSQPAVRLCYATGLLFIIALFLVRKTSPYIHRPIVAAFLVGYIIYGMRLAFLSSWVIWAWYDYPLLIGYIACLPSMLVMLVDGFRERILFPLLVPATALAVFLVALFGIPQRFVTHPSVNPGGVPTAAADLPNTVGASLDGAAIAMGDRAGSFAYHYPGSVSQLEGLMNNDQYLKILRTKQDVRDLLCDRRVRFVVAYEADLAAYKVHYVHTIRPELSQYAAPEIEVLRDDQVLRIPDLSQNHPADVKTYLYVWRLRCGPAQEPSTRSSRDTADAVGSDLITPALNHKSLPGAE